MIKFFFFHLTYNDWLNHPLISHFLNINNKSIGHVDYFLFIYTLLNAYKLHEFKSKSKSQIKISMTMRNSFGCNFAILGYELTHKCKLKQFLHALFAFIFFPNLSALRSLMTQISIKQDRTTEFKWKLHVVN